MASKQTVTAFIVDISPTMGDTLEVPDDAKPGLTRETTGLQLGLEYVKEKVGEKVLRGLKTDKVAIFTCGDAKTNNSLADQQEGYDHINEVVPFRPASVEHQKALRHLEPGPHEGDAISAVIVAIVALDAEVQQKKWKKEIVLVTDGMSQIDWTDGVEMCRDQLNNLGVELTVIGINFDDPKLPYKQEDKPTRKNTNEIMLGRMVDAMDQPAAFGNALRALSYVRAPRPTPVSGTAAKMQLTLGDPTDHPDTSLDLAIIVSKCVMQVRPMSQKKMSTLSGLRGRNVVEPSRGVKRKRANDDEGGDQSGLGASLGMSQAAQRFAETQTQRDSANSFDKRPYAPRDATFGINRDRKYFYAPEKKKPESLEALQGRAGMTRTASQAKQDDARADAASTDSEEDDDAEEVPKEELPEGVEMVKAYKYGATKVPMNGVDETELHLDAKPGVQILGFIDREKIPRDWHLGGSWWVFGDPASSRSQVSVSVLVHALYEKDLVAFVRYVANTKNAAPKLCALYPRFQDPEEVEEGDDRWEGFAMVQMPYSDDVRSYNFPSLKHLVNKAGKVLEEHKNLPTKAMDDVMRAFIQKNDLETAGRDEDGAEEPWFRTTECCNPSVHAVKRAVLYRAANPKDPDLPALHPDLARFLRPPELNVERSRDALAAVIDSFQIKKVPPKPKKQKAGVAPTVAQDQQGAAFDLDSILADVRDAPAIDAWGTSGRRLGGDSPPPDGMDVDGEDAQPNRDALETTQELVGFDDPIGDFERVIENREGGRQEEALEELASAGYEIFKHTIGSSANRKVLAIMQKCRDEAMNREAVKVWNRFIPEFKGAVLQSRHRAFWAEMRKRGLGLITGKDTQDYHKETQFVEEEGLATDEAAAKFWT